MHGRIRQGGRTSLPNVLLRKRREKKCRRRSPDPLSLPAPRVRVSAVYTSVRSETRTQTDRSTLTASLPGTGEGGRGGGGNAPDNCIAFLSCYTGCWRGRERDALFGTYGAERAAVIRLRDKTRCNLIERAEARRTPTRGPGFLEQAAGGQLGPTRVTGRRCEGGGGEVGRRQSGHAGSHFPTLWGAVSQWDSKRCSELT